MSYDPLYVGPSWLPKLMRYNDYGNYDAYEQAVFDVYQSTLVRHHALFEGKPVLPLSATKVRGRPSLFCHIIYGKGNLFVMKDDFRRLERVAWIEPIITHSGDSHVKVWSDAASGKLRTSLWLDEEYMVVLEPKGENAWRLVTAFCTDLPYMRKSYAKRYTRAMASKKSEVAAKNCDDPGSSSCNMAGEHST